MTSMLIAIASEADMVSALLDELKENLLDVKPGEEGFDEASLALKPTEGSGGMGVARIRTARDLAIYCQALALEAPHIPANALSTAPHGWVCAFETAKYCHSCVVLAAVGCVRWLVGCASIATLLCPTLKHCHTPLTRHSL